MLRCRAADILGGVNELSTRLYSIRCFLGVIFQLLWYGVQFFWALLPRLFAREAAGRCRATLKPFGLASEGAFRAHERLSARADRMSPANRCPRTGLSPPRGRLPTHQGSLLPARLSYLTAPIRPNRYCSIQIGDVHAIWPLVWLTLK